MRSLLDVLGPDGAHGQVHRQARSPFVEDNDPPIADSLDPALLVEIIPE